jgi:iron complex outermembrane receptor protein
MMLVRDLVGAPEGGRRIASRSIFLVGAAAIALTGGAVAHAQTAPAQADEVVVTAQRKQENIQTVPISLSAITAVTLQNADVKGIGDYFAMVPNVSYVTNGSRDRVDISVRGISNQLDPYGDVRPASYAFYIDDFNVAALTSNPQIDDLARVEVLRGPQGTYFGRNAEGGAINIATNRPQASAFYGDGSVDYSSFNTLRLQGDVNIPLIADKLAIRIAGQSDTSDGNIKNINPIGGGNNTDYKNIRFSIRATPIDNLTWDTTVDYSNEKDGMRDGVPTGYLTATWRSVYYKGAAGLGSPNGVGFFPSNTDEVNYNTPQSVGTEYAYISSRLSYDLPGMNFTGILGYGRSHVYNHGDVDGSSFDYFNEIDDLHRNTESAEFRLSSRGSSKLEWTAGANFGMDWGNTAQSTVYGTQSAPGVGAHPAGFQITGNYNGERDSYAAAFGQLTYHFTDKLSLLVGGRYSYEVSQGDFTQYSSQVLAYQQPNQTANFSDFSPKVTLDYQWSPDLLLFTTASKGYKAGGVQPIQAGVPVSYKPETLWNFEGGAKFYAFDHRLRADVTAFYEIWNDLQESERYLYLLGTTLKSFTATANAASAHSYGIEASVTAKVTPNFTVDSQFGWDEAKYDQWSNALIDGGLVNASGLPLVDAPQFTAGAQGEYRHKLTNDYDGFGRIEWSYRDKTYSNIDALRYQYFPFIAPAYSNVNLRVGLEREHWRMTFFVENLLNAKYYTNIYEKAFYSGVTVQPSFQSIGVSLTFKH